mgnify:CR=1 FL=1
MVQTIIEDQNQDSKRKDLLGEVFTPPILINELLDQLPRSIWKNPDIKWLDPCAGRANFFDQIYPRIMDGLAAIFPKEADRRNHILKNMFTMIEINESNVREIRKKWPGAKVIHQDFLEWTPPGGEAPPDILVANPPYQMPKTEEYKGSVGNQTLWDLFLKKAIAMGTHHIGFITPSNWRRPEHPLYQEIAPKLTYLHIYSKEAGLEHFSVQSRFDLYWLNTKKGGSAPPDTKIPLLLDEKNQEYRNQIDIAKWPFLPNYFYRTIQRFLVKKGGADGDGIPIIFHSTLYDARKLHKKRGKRYKYPVIHTITKEGAGIRWTDVRDSSQFGIPKVILNMNEKQYPILDETGKYGMSQLSFGIPIRTKKEGEAMIKCLNSATFQEIIRATKWGSFQTDYRMFTYFRKDFYKKICSGGGEAADAATDTDSSTGPINSSIGEERGEGGRGTKKVRKYPKVAENQESTASIADSPPPENLGKIEEMEELGNQKRTIKIKTMRKTRKIKK